MNTITFRQNLVEGTNLIRFTYTNWNGVTAVRTALPLSIEFGETPEHPEKCWMLRAHCQDKDAQRNFMMSKMLNVEMVG